MDGSYPGYLPYGQQHQPQSQQQQAPTGGPQSSHPSPSGPHHHHQQHPGLTNYGPIPGQHPNDSPTHPTLPPLQSQNGYSPYGSLPYGHAGSQSHTPPGSHTPVSASMGNGNGYPHPPSMMSAAYSQPYGISQSMMYPASTATSIPQSAVTAGLPTIRPMPPGGVNTSMSGLPSLASAGHLGQQPSFMQTEDSPTHVVGSQGRRGILPSAPGRPNPPPQGSGLSAKSMIPQKDADGKFPCPHCNKTYLHAKHLKRHLLRHTGDRPYMCHLCKDTFSRSDILKRHFQKCSIRRGNPTGANHLAHQRRPTNSNNRLSMTQQEGPIGLAGMAEAAGAPYNAAGVVNNSPSINDDMSTRSSRTNSLIGGGNMNHRNGIAGLGILSTSGTNGEQMGSSAAYQPGMSSYAMPTPPNGTMTSNYAFSNQSMNGSGYNTPTQPMSFLGQPSSRFNNPHHSSNSHLSSQNGDVAGNQIDWSRMFAAGGQDGFVGSHPANASSETKDIKSDEPTSKTSFANISALTNDVNNESFLGVLYSHPSNAFTSEYSKKEGLVPGFPKWLSTDPLLAKIESLKQFCNPESIAMSMAQPAPGIVMACLTVENVKHFTEYSLQFQKHWPILHTPTFKLTDANNLLVLAIICAGAVYSPKVPALQVRGLIDFVKLRVISSSDIYRRMLDGQVESLENHSWDLEELQALVILQVLSTWHGNSHERHTARIEFAPIIQAVRAMGLLHSVFAGHYAYSILHATPQNLSPPVNGQTFNWTSWVEQEKRNRLMYSAFLLDAMMVMFFNSTPHFDPLEIRTPLPCDDTAWNAKDAQRCANALGLNGALTHDRHMVGTRQAQQLNLHDALRVLLDPVNIMPTGVTNAYSKLILVHALIVRIIAYQKTVLELGSPVPAFNSALGGSGPATPLSQNDWLDQHASGGSEHIASADSLDTRPSMQAQHDKKRLGYSLDKWKQCWDQDTKLQDPPVTSQPTQFPTNGAYFFFLGRSFLLAQRAFDWIAQGDTRFKQVLTLLRQIRGFIANQSNESQGYGTGLAGEIDAQSVSESMVLDMRVLFPPIAA